MFQKLRTIFNPDLYQGWGKNKSYFEGWYYKMLSNDQQRAMAIIPGIAIDGNGKKQAFIQVLDGISCTAEYVKFDIDSFSANAKSFEISIGSNHFKTDRIILDLPNIKGELFFKNQVPWPSQWYSPGIMGPFSFIPFMECYHGILSMDHEIQGELKIGEENIDFSDGRGYMEKDWGKSFPSAYVWMQTNHFSELGASLKLSVANIPWLGRSFVGFIAGLYFENKLIEFTTYNRSSLETLQADSDIVELTLVNKKYRLEVSVERAKSTELASPIHGFMDGRISESMKSHTSVKLIDTRDERVVFNDKSKNVALEVAGKLSEILTQ